MNKKLQVLLLGLAASGLVSIAQDNPPPSDPPTDAAPPPAAQEPATPPPAEDPTPGTDSTAAPTVTNALPLSAALTNGVLAGGPIVAQTAPPPTETVAVEPVVTPPVSVPAPEPTPVPAAQVVAVEPAPSPTLAAVDTQAPAADAASQAAAEIVPLIVIDDVPLTDAIRNLARQSSLNFQFDPRVTASNQPNVSIRFENVTAQEALLAVLENYGLQLARDPRSKIARVTVKDPKAEEPLMSQVVQLRYSEPTNLVTILKSTLTPRSQVVVDQRTSQLIITTTVREMDAVLNLINRLDTPTRQVLIEARLYETARKPNSIRGIDWAGTVEGQHLGFGNNLGDPSGAPPPLPTGNPILVGGLAGSVGKILVDTAKGFNPGTAFLDADGVSAVISFLNKDIETDVVSMPRAVTLDNQPAVLSVTRAFPIFKVTPGSANSPAGAEITYTNLGTILTVTPRIAADNNIALRVIPEVSNVDGQDVQVLNNLRNVANIYAIRRIETHVMIPSGNTLVLGGLINDRRTKEYNKVPVLGDVPGLGVLFRKQSKARDKANLLIFITPTIVGESDFHPSDAGRTFLSSRQTEVPEVDENPLDSARPHDWTKPKSKYAK